MKHYGAEAIKLSINVRPEKSQQRKINGYFQHILDTGSFIDQQNQSKVFFPQLFKFTKSLIQFPIRRDFYSEDKVYISPLLTPSAWLYVGQTQKRHSSLT
ncbi:hypothetical protein ATANTOWER_030984 [Ataeniobius toweri]|uniref:Uncharacterized protein n=1 Tax=Ataeniobius toweri TaxID=208326 RepID=A0ABU7BVD4_9TELE|nr:hypothetical protein [Ataeniobius toweri]